LGCEGCGDHDHDRDHVHGYIRHVRNGGGERAWEYEGRVGGGYVGYVESAAHGDDAASEEYEDRGSHARGDGKRSVQHTKEQHLGRKVSMVPLW